MKRLRIALFGKFGVQNLGNECTLQAIILNIRERFPDAEIFCVCPVPDDTARRHGIPAVPLAPRYDTERASRPSPPRGALASLLHRLLVGIPAELRGWLLAFRALERTDMLVMTGTGMLMDWNEGAFGFPYEIFKWAWAARLRGCRVRFVAVGAGPIDTRLCRFYLTRALAMADYRSYRDAKSRTTLEAAGFDTTGDSIVPDLVFSLPASVLPAPERLDRPMPIVGLGVMDYYGPRGKSRQRDGAARHQAYLDQMCDFVVWLIEHRYTVRILHGDALYDAQVRNELVTRARRRVAGDGAARILTEDISSVPALLRELASTDVVVSPRFHNLLLATMLEKPVLALSYHPKDDALMESIGLGQYCEPLDDLNLDRLIERFTELVAHRDELEARLREKTRKYRSAWATEYRSVLDDGTTPRWPAEIRTMPGDRISGKLGA
jgi:polysaccharide pyruvyl transferase WcaK-like protein